MSSSPAGQSSIGFLTSSTALALLACCLFPAATFAQQSGWAAYGGDLAGTRFSASTQITRDNLQHLHPVWTFHTHALDQPRSGSDDASFETTPILSHDVLYLTSPFDVVFALDARTGQQRWSFDPHVGHLVSGSMVASRGVALWESSKPLSPGQCSRRLLFGTLDARLLAIDADTGTPCPSFGQAGAIDLHKDVYPQNFGFYELTSAPTIVGNIVVVGSSVGDNQQVDSESGLVRAFDVVTGKQLWSWEPLPWAVNNRPRTGAGNTWSTISADPALGLVYLPTGSASPDYWGGLRPGDNRDADSIVALDVHTGKKVWAFQLVHHDLWDYDVASQPLLFTFRDGTPAVAVSTKMGQVFVFDRRNGNPLYPIEERPVPQTDVPGEVTSPTQPFSSLPPVGPLTLPLNDDPGVWHRSLWNRLVCKVKLSGLRYDGIYTPPSLGGTIFYPGNLGGINWGSAAFDPATGNLYANNNRAAYSGKLVPQHGLYILWAESLEPAIRDWPLWIYSAIGILILNIVYHLDQRRLRLQPIVARDSLPSLRATAWAMIAAAVAAPMCLFPRPLNLSHFGHELSPQRGTPYRILRDPLVDSDKRPCITPPWGAVTALNLNTGKIVWESALGTMVPDEHTGIMNFGGPIVTASGLVFTAAAEDPFLRAFDSTSGEELWRGKLPVPAQATPMTYTLDGRQFIVIAAGGHSDNANIRGDSLIAFALDSTVPK
jgi:quinoprotein glucose dehydrogenase